MITLSNINRTHSPSWQPV